MHLNNLTNCFFRIWPWNYCSKVPSRNTGNGAKLRPVPGCSRENSDVIGRIPQRPTVTSTVLFLTRTRADLGAINVTPGPVVCRAQSDCYHTIHISIPSSQEQQILESYVTHCIHYYTGQDWVSFLASRDSLLPFFCHVLYFLFFPSSYTHWRRPSIGASTVERTKRGKTAEAGTAESPD